MRIPRLTPCASSLGLAALALTAPVAATAQESPWRVELRPRIAFHTMSGDIGFSGSGGDRTLDLGALTASAQPAFEMGVDVWYGEWGLLAEIGVVHFEARDATSQNAVFHANVQERIGHLGLARHLNEHLRVTAGARFWGADLDFSVGEPNPGELDGSDEWVDPYVGALWDIPIESGWYGVLEGDVGGFGVGSDFTWRFVAGVGYDVTEAWAVRIEYPLIGVDYTTEAASGGTVNYATMRHGPRLGINLYF